VDSKETRRIWQSSPPHYEYTSSLLSDTDDDTRPVTLVGPAAGFHGRQGAKPVAAACAATRTQPGR
jgi:hypothetical protein